MSDTPIAAAPAGAVVLRPIGAVRTAARASCDESGAF